MRASGAQNLLLIYDTFYIEKMDMGIRSFFLSQHVGLLTSSAAKHPEIIAIRYQLNLMELSRKLKTRRQYRGQPCTSNTDNKAE